MGVGLVQERRAATRRVISGNWGCDRRGMTQVDCQQGMGVGVAGALGATAVKRSGRGCGGKGGW